MSTTNIALNPITEKQLRQFIGQPSHALALIGPTGSGKTFAAFWIIGKILKGRFNTYSYPYFRLVAAEGLSITIEQIRDLAGFLKLKTTGAVGLRRFIVIEHAEALTLEAQNAFLKLLEEPPGDTLIILTLASHNGVLPTILSRAQRLRLRKPERQRLEKSINLPLKEFSQLYSLSDGLPGLLVALGENSSEHPLVNAIAEAKKLLNATRFERLQLADELARKKTDMASLLEAIGRIAKAGLNAASQHKDKDQLNRWQHVLAAAHEASLAFSAGAQSKLVFTNLALTL